MTSFILLLSYPTTLLRRTSSQACFTDFAYISRTSIFQNICSILFCTCDNREKTIEKSVVESIILRIQYYITTLAPLNQIVRQTLPLEFTENLTFLKFCLA